MLRIIAIIILRVWGWKLTGNLPVHKKYIIVIAPHTSNWDIIIGKLYMMVARVNNYVLVKKELFFFPLNILLKSIRCIPIDRGDKKTGIIKQTVNLFEERDEFCLVIAPEGTRKKTTNWKKGHLLIANKAHVPIVVAYLNYKKKEIGVKGVIEETQDYTRVMEQMNEMYADVHAKFPAQFALQIIKK